MEFTCFAKKDLDSQLKAVRSGGHHPSSHGNKQRVHRESNRHQFN